MWLFSHHLEHYLGIWLLFLPTLLILHKWNYYTVVNNTKNSNVILYFDCLIIIFNIQYNYKLKLYFSVDKTGLKVWDNYFLFVHIVYSIVVYQYSHYCIHFSRLALMKHLSLNKWIFIRAYWKYSKIVLNNP